MRQRRWRAQERPRLVMVGDLTHLLVPTNIGVSRRVKATHDGVQLALWRPMSDRTKGPVSRRRRFMKLAGMTASVATNYARSQVKGVFQDADTKARDKARNNARSGELIAQTLGELKGAAMKVGQIASVARDILPDDLIASLASLQRDAPPMDYEVIAAQIERELGSPPELLFQRFDRVPFAAASIGQVHRARTDDGREVVVKVQYPGVDESVDSDIAHLKLALRASGMISVRREAFDGFFAELRDRMREEVDYTHEAQNVRWFRALHADDDHLVIPEVVGERSSGRILTLTYEPGDQLSELDEKGYDQATRNLIGARLTDMLYRQIFEFHAVHADPNPANLAFRRNGDVVLYDFGCVKAFPQPDAAHYRNLMRAFRDADHDAIQVGMERVGIQRPGAQMDDRAEFYEQIRSSFGPFLFEDVVFDCHTAHGHEIFTRMMVKALRRPKHFQPSAAMLFTDRAQTGQFMNLVKLRSQVNMHRIYMKYLEMPQQGDAGFSERMRGVPARPPV
ncbi:MAG: protein kinase [Deltaproteobacteria bacterium]|nr:protein kinase [Deltaproteobacteria bacterium]HCH63436.1 protein kinase [Deltaproteobacteria bacterium]